MKTLISTLAVVITLAASMPALEAQSGYDLFQKALAAERTDGNLREAIRLYEQAAAQSKGDRALAVQALLRAAECYQKLGDTEAQRIYRRIVDQFVDQTDAVGIARSRLGSTAAPAGVPRARLAWVSHGSYGAERVSPDGRFVSYVEADGRLMLRDVSANLDRPLTAAVPSFAQYAGHSAWSNDAQQIVFRWWNDVDLRTSLRIASVSGRGYVQPREIYSFTGVRGDDWFDWSPDGRLVAIGLRRQSGTAEIALVTVPDGRFRVLKTLPGLHVPNRIFFSADSRYIAYDLPAGAGEQRDIFVMAIDTAQERPAVVHRANEGVVGWAPDGSRLLFTSDRTGSSALWGLRWVNGAFDGSPELLRADASGVSLGVSTAGAIHLGKRVTTRDFAIASIDLDRGTLGQPSLFSEGFLEAPGVAAWSPDGAYLAYSVACTTGCLAVRSVATGDVRRLPVTTISQPFWSPDSRTLLARGRDAGGRTGLFQIDAQSGAATALLVHDSLYGPPQWAPGGAKILFIRDNVMTERELATGLEREVATDIWSGGTRVSFLSPDGRHFLATRQNERLQAVALTLVPVSGGERRDVLRVSEPETLGFAQWTPDGRAIVVVKEIGARRELWLVPVDNGAPRKLGIDPTAWLEGSTAGNRGFTFSPDGRRIAYQTGRVAHEIWALENFLPATTAKR